MWTPSRGAGAPRRAAQCEVKPLFGICVQLLVEYIDDVETLWGLPDAIKVRICLGFFPSGLTASRSKMLRVVNPLW